MVASATCSTSALGGRRTSIAVEVEQQRVAKIYDTVIRGDPQ